MTNPHSAAPSQELPAEFQKTRQRKYHRRSRGGCASCKRRHVRCDEKRPLCTNCLRSGSECGYADPFVSTVVGPEVKTPSPRPLHIGTTSTRSLSLLDMQPGNLTFSGFPVEMPMKSRWLFHTFVRQRVRDRPGIPGPSDSFVIHQALSDPGFLHGSLILSAVQWLWATGDFESVKLPLLHHKLEAYKYVGQQISKPSTATSDSTIAAVATLALMEASLWETNPWAGVVAIATHLQGIRRIMDLLGKPVRHDDLSLFQRTIRMALSSILYGEIASKYDFDESYYLPPPISLLFMAMWPITREGRWQGDDRSDKVRWFAHASNPRPGGFAAFNGIPTDPSQLATFTRISRCAFMSCYLYMALLLQKGATSSFIINWLVEQILDDAARTEQAFVEGRCARNVWLWTMIFGLSAVASTTASNKLEQSQIHMWRTALQAKIRLANRVMGLDGWDIAKESLRRVAWVEGFEGEQELKSAWEESAFG